MRRARSIVTAALFLLLAACERAPDEQTLRELITSRTLGLAYLEEGRFDEAEAEFRKLIELERREPLGYANLGLVHMLVDDPRDAEPYLTQALELAPGDPDIRYLLAQMYLRTDREAEGLAELERTLEVAPDHVRTLYALAELAGRSETPKDRERREDYLTAIAEVRPTNLMVRIHLVELLLQTGKADEAVRHLEDIERMFAELSPEAKLQYEATLRLARASRSADALAPAAALHAALRQTNEYAVAIPDLIWQGLQRAGFSAFSREFTVTVTDDLARAQLDAIRFVDVTGAAGLDGLEIPDEPAAGEAAPGGLLAAADYDGDGDVDLYVLGRSTAGERAGLLMANQAGVFSAAGEEVGLVSDGREAAAAFGDYDNDGWLDLYVVTAGPDRLYRNQGDGTFADVSTPAGMAGESAGRSVVFLDADHDGDLDIYVTNEGANHLHRNNGDGTFSERAEAMGLAGGPEDSRRAVFGDYDVDGDIDLFVANSDAPSSLYMNLRHGRFGSGGARSGEIAAEAVSAAAGDYDNDGRLDLFSAGPGAGDHRFFRNSGDGSFEPQTGFAELERLLQEAEGLDASFLDFDNDGFLDLVIAAGTSDGAGRGLFLLHNDGGLRFEDFSNALPGELSGSRRVMVFDLEGDGDLDLLVSGSNGELTLLRNDGGNANHFLDLRLVGLRQGSGKANHFGIGARVEVRAGGMYQAHTVVSPTTHIGLGSRPQADAVRVIWTNGVPQTLFRPRSGQTLVQRQVLKGSCPFVYAWDGNRFSFVTDVMWRSALGMPLGIMGADQAYAPAAASREYVRIPADALKERDGEYVLQLTEELWEIFYVDEVKLIAVDHAAAIDIFVNERFVPPGAASLTVHQVARARVPVSATDGDGGDLLPKVRERDDIYVSNLRAARYQGVVELHDLILDLGEFAESEPVTLYLQGWIFPTDASINVAMSQSSRYPVIAPYLEVVGPDGRWMRAIDDLGFPAGKSKTVVADLTGRFPTADHRVRIRTNMQIYWDRVFFSVGSPTAELRTTALDPASADLHFRGFSREYRKGGRYGPHWFDYADVSSAARWLPLDGAFTRFGDVRPLLLDSDNRYVIMGPGDEATITFDGRRLPPVQPGWSRDFLLYTVGWVKDADLNTATGSSVAPLPFHAMSSYPYGPDESYPDDEAHRAFLSEYNTRRFGSDVR